MDPKFVQVLQFGILAMIILDFLLAMTILRSPYRCLRPVWGQIAFQTMGVVGIFMLHDKPPTTVAPYVLICIGMIYHLIYWANEEEVPWRKKLREHREQEQRLLGRA